MKQILFLLLLFSFTQVSAQEIKELARLVILDHRFNNQDLTDWSLDKENYIVLFLDEENDLCMANVTNEGQSYGVVTRLQHENIEATKEIHELDHYSFRWSYNNTYNSEKGSCFIQLILSHREQAVIYNLRMIDDNVNVSEYKGYVEGTLNLDEYIDNE